METFAEHYESMRRTILKCMPGADMELIDQAVCYAKEQHEGQKRKDGSPYIIHPLADPVKNRELSARREELKELVAQPNAGALDLTLVLWDEELTQVVGPLEQNVRLMSVLYPVTAALSVLIAIGVSVLLLFQSAREMAALRAMGCTRRRVTGMFSCQQGLLCLLGILLGLVALGALRGGMEGVWKGKTLLCAGLYFLGATIGAMVTSTGLGRRKPMELLQIKE